MGLAGGGVLAVVITAAEATEADSCELLQHTSDVSVRSVEGKLAHEMGSTSKDQKSMMLYIKANLDERAWLHLASSRLQDPEVVGRVR